jgi:bifunctional non-homologous end joining protein LigD
MPTTLSLPGIDHVPGAGLPDIEPVGLLSRPDPFDSPDWMFEPEYDGFPALLYAAGTRCEVRTPPEIRFDGAAELCERVARVLGAREAILDGVIVSLDGKGKPSLRDLLRGRGFLAFAASDLLWLDGHDLRALPLAERKARLAALLPSDTGPLYKIFTLEEHGRALFQTARKLDLAGIVAKRKLDAYGPGTVWYRVRNGARNPADGSAATSAAPPRAAGARTRRAPA